MIKYRYTNLDPEPPATVTRIGTDSWSHYGQYRSGVKHWEWEDRWTRVPCRGRGHGTVMANGDPRREAREHARSGWGPLSRRRKRSYGRYRVGRLCHPGDAGTYPDHPEWDGHYHWWNQDKMRHWASLRGAEKRFDLDAYRRMHIAYTRRWKKRK